MEQVLKDYPFRSVLSLKTLIDYLNQSMEDSSGTKPCLKKDFQEMLRQAPELYGPIEDDAILERHRDLVQRLMSLVFPPVFWDTEAVAAMVPFSMKPFSSPLILGVFSLTMRDLSWGGSTWTRSSSKGDGPSGPIYSSWRSFMVFTNISITP